MSQLLAPVRSAEHPLRRRLRAIRRRLSSPDGVWRRALPSEVAFWSDYVRTGGLEHPDEFRRRLDPQAPIEDPLLLDAIERVGGDLVRIIDVGAGPLTSVGRRDPRDGSRRVEVVAVDPLGEEYARLLADAGVTAPVPTQACRGEELAARFGEGTFDVAYARNALDHSADAMAALESMVTVVRPGGAVVLVHGRREAEARGYEQLHQWNFDVRGGRLVLFNQRRFHDVAERLGDRVEVSAEVIEVPVHGAFVGATMVRLATASATEEAGGG